MSRTGQFQALTFAVAPAGSFNTRYTAARESPICLATEETPLPSPVKATISEIEVTVSAIIPLHPDQRRGQLTLQLISIDARYTYIDLLNLALRQTELDFKE